LKSGDKVSVSVSWVVTDTGQITDARIEQSAGKAVDDAVLGMLAKQKYEPGMKKGQKVKVRLLRMYTFRSG
jgi:TonB family protein